MESVLEIDPLTEFLSAIKNPLTRDHYQRHLPYFFQYLKLEGDLRNQAREFVKRAKADPSWATYQINGYMHTQRERAEKGDISESTLANYWKPIKLLCDESDVTLNWKKILRRIPKGLSYAEDTIPDREEITRLCSYPDPRIRPAVLIMESSGCRIGAFDGLTVGHVEPILDEKKELVTGKIILYPGTTDKYFSFITPECYRSIETYLDHRKEAGERITKDSPLIRDLILGYDRWGKGQAHRPVPLKSSGVKRLIEDALKVMGLRKKLAPGKRRHAFSSCHSLRKVFKTSCEKGGMKSLYVEMLMGHRLGVSQSYVRPSEKDLLDDYIAHAVPELSIFFEARATPREDLAALEKKFESRLQSLEERAAAAEARAKAAEESNLETLRQLINSPGLRGKPFSKEEIRRLQDRLKRLQLS